MESNPFSLFVLAETSDMAFLGFLAAGMALALVFCLMAALKKLAKRVAALEGDSESDGTQDDATPGEMPE